MTKTTTAILIKIITKLTAISIHKIYEKRATTITTNIAALLNG